MSRREPLHQAPNPEDLRRVPPATSECAVVRGMLRDFADADLAAAEAALVENHVHSCRTCAIELSRAEHETLRLRRLFATTQGAAARLPAGFAASLVERLVLDETSMVRPEALAAAVAGAQAADAVRNAVSSGAVSCSAASPTRQGIGPMGLLFFATMVLAVLVGSIAVFDMSAKGPERVARLVVVDAHGLADGDGRTLTKPNGLGEQQSLRVGRGGEAHVDWHDLSSKMQPAASLALYGAGEVRMVDGRPLLVSGNVEVTTNRAVSIPIADGSRLDLGVGQYVLTAEQLDLLPDSLPPSGQLSVNGAPTDLFVKIEVRRGDPATVVRSATNNVIVKAGQVQIYQGSSTFVPTAAGGVDATTASEITRVGALPVPAATTALALSGVVLDPVGQPGIGAEVRLSLALANGVQNVIKGAAGDGSFVVPLDRSFDSDFVVALAFAGGANPVFGMVAPNAWPLTRVGQSLQLRTPITLGFSVPLTGSVVDDFGVPRGGVTVLPCILDELFGHVMALQQFRTTTGPGGLYRIERLPSLLPPHQTLALLLLHPALEPTVVPVPQRGTVVAADWAEPATMRHLRTVRLHMFGAHATVQIYEEIDGLPAGAAAWRHTATTDANGYVDSFQVGRGRLWVRGGAVGAPMARELVMDEVAPLPQYRPDNQAPIAFGSLFRPLQLIPDTGVEITNSYRHQRFSLSQGEELRGGRTGLVVDGFGHPVARAQVFAVETTGPRGAADSRFLGFTAEDGMFACGSLPTGGELLVVGEDGTIGAMAGAGAAPAIVIPIRHGGRVRVAESLRPSTEACVAIRFERDDTLLVGMRPVATRFVSAATAWEVGDLPPGRYTATIHTSSRTVIVPTSGVVVLQ